MDRGATKAPCSFAESIPSPDSPRRVRTSYLCTSHDRLRQGPHVWFEPDHNRIASHYRHQQLKFSGQLCRLHRSGISELGPQSHAPTISTQRMLDEKAVQMPRPRHFSGRQSSTPNSPLCFGDREYGRIGRCWVNTTPRSLGLFLEAGRQRAPVKYSLSAGLPILPHAPPPPAQRIRDTSRNPLQHRFVAVSSCK